MKGTIRVRENRDGTKSYVCQVKLGRDPGTGRQRFLTGTAKSERAAHRLLHELVGKADDRSQQASDATVATVIEQWLATGGPAGEATRQVYAGYIRLHVLPALGGIPLRRLGVADIERGYAALRDKGLGPASIRKPHTVVRAALAQAVRWAGRRRTWPRSPDPRSCRRPSSPHPSRRRFDACSWSPASTSLTLPCTSISPR